MKKYLILAGVLINIMAVTGCGQLLNATVGAEVIPETEGTNSSAAFKYEVTNIDRQTEDADAFEINLEMLAQNNVPQNCSYDGYNLVIQEEGSYVILGKSEECRIVVDVYDDEIVHLLLNNVQLTAEEGPAVYVENADKVIITAMEDTVNTISDGTEYADDREACIFSNVDLTLNGAGSLQVYGYFHDAVRSKDRVKVVETNLTIRSKNNAVRGNDGVLLENSNIEIESEGIGVLSKAEQDFVVIRGGSCKVISGENAVAAENYVAIEDCDCDLYSVRESVKCNGVKMVDEDKAK